MVRCLFHRTDVNFCIWLLVVVFSIGTVRLMLSASSIGVWNYCILNMVWFQSCIWTCVCTLALWNLLCLLNDWYGSWSLSWSPRSFFFISTITSVICVQLVMTIWRNSVNSSSQFVKTTNAEHRVCVRTCAHIWSRPCALAACSCRYIQHLCGDGCLPLPHKPPPAVCVYLTRFVWKDMFGCVNIYRNTSVSFLFLFSVSFF